MSEEGKQVPALAMGYAVDIGRELAQIERQLWVIYGASGRDVSLSAGELVSMCRKLTKFAERLRYTLRNVG